MFLLSRLLQILIRKVFLIQIHIILAQKLQLIIGIDQTDKSATKLIANIIVLFRVVGVGIAIIMLMSLAAKFIWGSVEQKAEVKKYIIVYVTGAAVFFTSSQLLGLLQDFIQ